MQILTNTLNFIANAGDYFERTDEKTRRLKRILSILLVLILLGLWANMVIRATRGHGSQYDDFTEFSRDLLFNQVNVYEVYDLDVTSIGKYPPFFAMVYAPLVPLPLPLGAAIWFLFSVVMMVLASKAAVNIVMRFSEISSMPHQTALWAVPLALIGVVTITNLETSQVNIFIFSLVLLGLDQFSKNKDMQAGLLLGVATAIKITPGLFIAYFFYKRSWKMVFWASAGVLICWGVILPLALTPSRFLPVLESWLGIFFSFITEGTIAEGVTGFRHTNQSLSAVIYRFFTDTPANGGFENFYVNILNLSYTTAGWIMKILKIGILVGLALVCRAPMKGRKDPRIPLELSLVAIATLYLSPISWINHYIVMILPFVVAYFFVKSRKPLDQQGHKMLVALAWSAFLVAMIHPLIMTVSLPFFGSLLMVIFLIKGIRWLKPSAEVVR